jgi:hypothetical protein
VHGGCPVAHACEQHSDAQCATELHRCRSNVEAADLHDALEDAQQLPIIAAGFERLGGRQFSLEELSKVDAGALACGARLFGAIAADRTAKICKKLQLKRVKCSKAPARARGGAGGGVDAHAAAAGRAASATPPATPHGAQQAPSDASPAVQDRSARSRDVESVQAAFLRGGSGSSSRSSGRGSNGSNGSGSNGSGSSSAAHRGSSSSSNGSGKTPGVGCAVVVPAVAALGTLQPGSAAPSSSSSESASVAFDAVSSSASSRGALDTVVRGTHGGAFGETPPGGSTQAAMLRAQLAEITGTLYDEPLDGGSDGAAGADSPSRSWASDSHTDESASRERKTQELEAMLQAQLEQLEKDPFVSIWCGILFVCPSGAVSCVSSGCGIVLSNAPLRDRRPGECSPALRECSPVLRECSPVLRECSPVLGVLPGRLLCPQVECFSL